MLPNIRRNSTGIISSLIHLHHRIDRSRPQGRVPLLLLPLTRENNKSWAGFTSSSGRINSSAVYISSIRTTTDDNMTSLETAWLPKLPVPSLEQTMASYLEAVQVAVGDEEQKAETRSKVERFLSADGVGPKLQQLLIEKQSKEDNWAYHWWLDDMYMCNDIALPVNSNPGMAFPRRRQELSKDVAPNFVQDVADFVSAILDYKELIDRQLLPQDRALSREKGQPLCMAQYQRLFASYRTPGLEQDQLRSFPPPDENEHIIVAHQGQFWRLEVRHKGCRLSAEEMAFNFAAIMESTDGQKSSTLAGQQQQPQSSHHQHYPPLGLLTTANRRLWAQWRHQLLQDLINARSLQSIESSSMIVCIDQPFLPPPPLSGVEDEEVNHRVDTNRLLQMIHGGGSHWNTINRWFDKTVQFIFSPDGISGTCYEHSPAEGIVLVQVIEKALENVQALQQEAQQQEQQQQQDDNGQPIRAGGRIRRSTLTTLDNDDDGGRRGSNGGGSESGGGAGARTTSFPAPKRLTWKIDEDTRTAIETAAADVDRLVEDLDLRVFRFTPYGKNRIKTFNVSPDVYIQLMLQWTYYKLHGKLVATYESAATRRFQLGRVDNIRSASSASLAWVKAMDDPDTPVAERISLFYKAAENQTDVMIRNILGQGMDNHLLGLRQLAKHIDSDEAAAVFQDPSFQTIHHFALSTSQIPTSSADSFMGYGPVVPDGYGCSYNPQPDCVIFCASAFKSCESTSVAGFVRQLSDTLVQVGDMLENRSPPPPPK
ncbi:choline O-acetyltransferase-like isoform X1 [Daphnia pulex]|uniref:choline O-acetyltransferase-like isoform X1 n=1 Tax=Daphnia pulex TaxID=6669 RepID=UPI001EDFBF70|nr:choline O-acetyltransferase-like isoform X1 [Daphnia pulex]